MEFTDDEKLKIQSYFENGEYGIIRRTVGYKTNIDGEYVDSTGTVISTSKVLNSGKTESDCVPNDDWQMVSQPEWRWDLYEYRAFAVSNELPDTSNSELQVDPLFVYGYGYQIYFNDAPNGEIVNLYNYNFNSISATNAFDDNVTIGGDFQARGSTNIIGTSNNTNTTLTVVGMTHDSSTKLGPKLRFENASGSNHIDLLYSDTGDTPTLTLSSTDNNEILYVPREKVTNEIVENETVASLKVTTEVADTINVTTLNLTNVADVIYPVGSYYWSTSSTSPATLFGGTWAQIKDAFLYATTYSEESATTATHGEESHTLTTSELPSHTHELIDNGHTHIINDPGHSHSINDPGHCHSIKTIGDDYNGSGRSGSQKGSGNFVQDGWDDMTSENTKRGIIANNNTTGISLKSTKSNITVDTSTSGISVDYAGGGQAHNNMPPYIACYCWHRVS